MRDSVKEELKRLGGSGRLKDATPLGYEPWPKKKETQISDLERVARAICLVDKVDEMASLEDAFKMVDIDWHNYKDYAEAAITELHK